MAGAETAGEDDLETAVGGEGRAAAAGEVLEEGFSTARASSGFSRRVYAGALDGVGTGAGGFGIGLGGGGGGSLGKLVELSLFLF